MALFLWTAPRGDHHSLAAAGGLTQHFGLGEASTADSPQTANPGSIPPLGTTQIDSRNDSI